MGITRTYRKAATVLPLLIVTAFGGLRGPGKYNGVVVFDRWGGCHLYSGVYLMEISEKVKESLRAYQGKAVLIDAQEVWQPMNPGDGLITKLHVLGPAQAPYPPHAGGPPNLEGLSLRVIPDFPAHGTDELIVEVTNSGKSRREIDTNELAPTLLAQRQGGECESPADGPSYAAVTRMDVALLRNGPAGATCMVGGKGKTVRLFAAPGTRILERVGLDPGMSIEVPLRFQLSPGEYEFLAGYGGAVHEGPALTSNQVGFDVDAAGKGHLTKGSQPLSQARPARRAGDVCGRVALEDGRPASQAQVFLWPFPIAERRPRAVNSVAADESGRFRMASVEEGNYVLSAVRHDSVEVLAGVLGGRHLAGAAALAVPDATSGCSLLVTVRAQPGYTVRGQTRPDRGSSGKRKAQVVMTSGDAYPFESTAVVESDGRYEFRNVPAGGYELDAGATGSSFWVVGDVDHLEIPIQWPEADLRQGSRSPVDRSELEGNEVWAAFLLRELHSAQLFYSNTYGIGFAGSLNVLGPPPQWSQANADRAGAVDETAAGLRPGDDGMHFTERGYRVTYVPGPPDKDGRIAAYALSARPVEFGRTGFRSFFLDQGGIVHETKANRAATRTDPMCRD